MLYYAMLDTNKQGKHMEQFTIHENVPVETHRLERTAGSVAVLGRRLAVRAGQGALLAYARVFDDLHDTNYRAELLDEFAA